MAQTWDELLATDKPRLRHAILIQMLPRRHDDPDTQDRIVMQAETYANMPDALDAMRKIRHQNLPYRNMWLVSFPDPAPLLT